MNIKSLLQIKNEMAVISSESMAILLGRKHLSILRSIDSIPTEYLRVGMFLMIDGEMFLSAVGVCALPISKRHLHMRHKIMMAMFKLDDEYQAKCRKECETGMPPRAIIKLCVLLGDIGAPGIALALFKIGCWFTGYKPRTS
jgi:hypothetical protein